MGIIGYTQGVKLTKMPHKKAKIRIRPIGVSVLNARSSEKAAGSVCWATAFDSCMGACAESDAQSGAKNNNKNVKKAKRLWTDSIPCSYTCEMAC